MSTLKENLQEIKRQKDTYIKPENIKKGVTVFGITGTLENTGSSVDYSNNNYEIIDGKLHFKNVFGKTGFESDLIELDIPEEIEFVIQKNKDNVVFYFEQNSITSSTAYLYVYIKNDTTDKFHLSKTSYYGDDKFQIGTDWTLSDELGKNNYKGIVFFVSNSLNETGSDKTNWRSYEISYKISDMSISSSSNRTNYYKSISPYYKQILCAGTNEISEDWVCSDFFKWNDVYNTDETINGKSIHYIVPNLSVYDKATAHIEDVDITDDMITGGLPATITNPGGTYTLNVTEELFQTKIKWYKNDNGTYGIAIITPWLCTVYDIDFTYNGTQYGLGGYVSCNDYPGVLLTFYWKNEGSQDIDNDSASSLVIYNVDICELNKNLETELDHILLRIPSVVTVTEQIM